MFQSLLITVLLLVLPTTLNGIETVHHDKPEESRISNMATMKKVPLPLKNDTERQKRLLPYINYYNYENMPLPPQRKQQRNNKIIHYTVDSDRLTPFLDTNALPGSFVPINYQNQYVQQPNFHQIYDKLAQLKQSQALTRTRYPTILVPVRNRPRRPPPSTKTTIETYTPTQIDVSAPDNNYNEKRPYIYNVIHSNKAQAYPEPDYNFREKILPQQQPIYFYPSKVEANNNQVEQNPISDEKAIIYSIHEAKPHHVNTIIDDKYVAQKILHPVNQYAPVQFIQTPVYEEVTTPQPANTLTLLLKQLQDTNTLPHTITSDNIDNSIRTLVKILNNLKKQRKLSAKPIIVAEEKPQVEDFDEYNEEKENERFPENTIEGGTPGKPGIDYPALSTIPPTSFNCKTQRYKGFFGDPDTHCQVWHYCDLNGGQASFLCPNGTIFSQVALTCDWWYNVKCDNTAQLYVLNERLYKYILPLSPKFPEDYSGPLVDKYLALKFQEMEAKMKEEKKNESSEDKSTEIEADQDDSDQLQEIARKNEAKLAADKT